MSRATRTLAFAAAVSVALHVAVLGGLPAFDGGGREPLPPPLQVQLVAAPPVQEAVAEPPKAIAPAQTAGTDRKKAPVRTASVRSDRAIAHPAPHAPSVAFADRAVDPEPGPTSGAADIGLGEGAIPASGAEPSASPEPPSGNALAAAADSGAPAAYPIRSLKAVYDLYYSSASPDAPVGRVTQTWSTDGQHYVAESIAEGIGLVSLFYSGTFAQRSEGRIGAAGLVPEVYTLRRGRAESTDVARFDWAGATVELESKGETRTVAIAPGAQDPLSAQHQFYFVQPLAASGQFRVADGRKLRAFWYEVVGEELLETPLGVVNTIRIRRADRDDSTADVWVDPRRSYLPMKIHATDRKGRIITQQIRSLEVEPLATAAAGSNPTR
ncbi:MAG: DUF3108 domain-containing protein [Burkholderiales bacterium]|nr:DUF3108 domain-containing protein [Burkholderiales bacterium]